MKLVFRSRLLLNFRSIIEQTLSSLDGSQLQSVNLRGRLKVDEPDQRRFHEVVIAFVVERVLHTQAAVEPRLGHMERIDRMAVRIDDVNVDRAGRQLGFQRFLVDAIALGLFLVQVSRLWTHFRAPSGANPAPTL